MATSISWAPLFPLRTSRVVMARARGRQERRQIQSTLTSAEFTKFNSQDSWTSLDAHSQLALDAPHTLRRVGLLCVQHITPL